MKSEKTLEREALWNQARDNMVKLIGYLGEEDDLQMLIAAIGSVVMSPFKEVFEIRVISNGNMIVHSKHEDFDSAKNELSFCKRTSDPCCYGSNYFMVRKLETDWMRVNV